MSKQLREGYTTGSSATAAAMAAIRVLFNGSISQEIEIPLPVKGTLNIPVERVLKDGNQVRGVVIKDGGDDPDATHGHKIHALVKIENADSLRIEVDGGKGIGRVTLPGLPVPVGEAAINPVPRKQIIAGALKELSEIAPDFNGRLKIIIEVPQGEAIAKETMNSRLGILGGISILGTQGIVRPYSHASWKASIAQSLNVARAAGLDEIVFTTGRRSEQLYLAHFPETPQISMVQAADFFKFSMQQAKLKGMRTVRWAIFIGKLVKHAMGFPYTHAKDWAIDFNLLADWCAELGMAEDLIKKNRAAITARHVYEMVPEDSRTAFIRMLVRKAHGNARAFSGNSEVAVEYFLFDFDGQMVYYPDHQKKSSSS
ncbi:cobalt-precorrin-5B (C(1))-methyltransferase CbiD [Maridesulfovibrio salexigens]|uniref:Cobalt-precorrin-5B C(1)-methyltransferase n=1 Tax=Maridesulfovibrio salexigens (strain ATCC 14822 / DSM 2638 / NCIMB 8403 / VKM B-1763) TaxID=526222 RepID=C6BW90_MARSD|nr:cobalt-precorrin-5B (C(1))-methyltransferase CbiD [Maridesulfovibrio salexigens]ACS78334.1 cobalamin biosynthesis protein CbiD [Maridesulfovibrio salexigens DSM 2638]